MAENTFDDIVQKERDNYLKRNQEYISAVKRDSLGSYERALKHARENALPKTRGLYTTRNDWQFIEKIRSIATTELKNQRANENNELQAHYNLNSMPNSRVGSFIDVPTKYTDALGRDVGEKIGDVTTSVASGVASVFGSEGSIMNGVNTVGQYRDAFLKDVKSIDKVSPWIKKKLQGVKDKLDKKAELKDVNSLFDKMNRTFARGIRAVLGDFADVLNEWYHDPKTLCCLIKTLTAVAITAAGKNKDFTKAIKLISSGKIKFSELTSTGEFFNKIISILKIIRGFLTQSMNFNFNLNLDLGLSMSKASIGALMALLSALQQMLEDKIYAQMMTFVEKKVAEEVRACVPFERLLRLIADWMTGPDGIFKYIEQFVDAYMIGFANNAKYGFNQATKMKMMDVAALDKLIKLLEELRDSVLNFEMCIEADFTETPTTGDDGDVTKNTNNSGFGVNPINEGLTRGIPTDKEVFSFVTNRMGMSPDFARQVLDSANKSSSTNAGIGSGSSDNAGGTGNIVDNLKMTIGDCARTLTPSRIEEIAKIMSDWEII